jgi:hypothetical protein
MSGQYALRTAAVAAILFVAGVHAQAEVSTPIEGSYTVPKAEYDGKPSGCSAQMAGCTGELVTLQHEVSGTVNVIDDCTFEVTDWQFDGLGPVVEWWGAKQTGDPKVFPYKDPTAKKIAELGKVGSYPKGARARIAARLKGPAHAHSLRLCPFYGDSLC